MAAHLLNRTGTTPAQADLCHHVLTAAEVAEMLQMSVAWIRAHANGTRRPVIPCVRLGRSLRFRLQDIERIIAGERF